jgi:RHS repeat-associated protein
VLTQRDGSQYWFDRHAPNKLARFIDRFGNTVRYVYDGGLLMQVISPNGRSIGFTYNAGNLIASATDSSGRTVRYGYHLQQGLQTTVKGYLLDRVDYPDGTNETYTYHKDTSGSAPVESWWMESIVDRRGNTQVVNTYDVRGAVTKQTYADGSTTQFDYERSQGVIQAVVVTDANSNKERTEFDPASRYATTSTRAYGTPLAQVFRQSRDSAGHVVDEVDALGRHRTYAYDALGNPSSASLVTSTGETATSRYSFTSDSQIESATDPLGHVTRFGYTNGCMTSVTNPLGKTVTLVCNAAGQVTSWTDPEMRTTRLVYKGGDLVAVTDALGQVTAFAYDVSGRRISTTGPDGASYISRYDTNDRQVEILDPQGARSQWDYDGNGNLTGVTLPNGASVSYGFDAMNRRTSRTDAAGRTMSWTYDAKGLPKSVEDAKHQVTTYSHDALDQMSLITFADGSGIQVSYDATGRPVEFLDSAYGTLSRTYDDFGRLKSETSLAGTVSYEYDLAGRRTRTSVTGKGDVVYGYDDADQLTSIASGSRLFRFAYDPVGRRISADFPNGVAASYGYDPAGRLLHLTYQNAQGQIVADSRYMYDATGRRIAANGPAASAAPLPNAVVMSFDKADRLTAVNGDAYTYDANGNLVSDGSRTYVWDARERLVQVKQGDSTLLDVAYDPLGRRSSKSTEEGNTTTYLYDGLDMIGRSGPNRSEFMINGLGLDEHLASFDADRERYFSADGTNSTVALTDVSGQLTSTYAYDPYGVVQTTGEDAESLLFTGRERDLVDLYFYRARYYLPASGRFMSSDPLEFAAGQTNFYSYVAGDPTNRRDPLGLWSWSFEAYLGFGGAVVIGQDPKTGDWFYGGRLGVGASIGGSLDPKGKRPGAGQDGSDCGHGTTLGVFNQLNASAGVYGGNIVAADAGLRLDGSGQGYIDSMAPSDNLQLNRWGFGIGVSTGVEIIGH